MFPNTRHVYFSKGISKQWELAKIVISNVSLYNFKFKIIFWYMFCRMKLINFPTHKVMDCYYNAKFCLRKHDIDERKEIILVYVNKIRLTDMSH